jgi:hypothetical protein
MRNGQTFLAVALCLTTGCSPDKPAQSASQKVELADALPPNVPSNCVSPNPRERSMLDLAASVIEKTGEGDLNWLDIGAQKYLSRNPFRRDGAHTVAVCIPDDILNRVSQAFISRKGFGKGRLVEYQLELALRLPNRSRYIVEAVGQSAFNTNVQQSETFNRRDIRPFARTVLAGFGAQSKEFGNIAYEQMSSKTSMGTGAAQVAAAAEHPNALPRIEQMMEEALSAVPSDKAIPRDTRDRLYELAWAIFISGEDGKRYTKPIHKIMQKKVESWAPPFGMVEIYPKRLCGVLRRIEGNDSVKPYAFCRDEKIPFEQ